MSDAVDTAPLPVVGAPRRRRRRWPIVLLVLVAVVAVLAVVAAIAIPRADTDVRAQAERQIETSVQNGLPSGVQGFATATIHGSSVLTQLANGRFDDVTITMADLHVDGQPASAHAEVHGLPVHGGRVGSAVVTVTVDQATVRSFAPLTGTGASAPTLGAGTIGTTVTQKVLTLPVLIAITLKPALSGTTLTLSPTDATVKAGPLSVPATPIVQALYPHGIRVCTAQYLPPGLRLTAIQVRRDALTATLAARNLDLDALQSSARGHC